MEDSLVTYLTSSSSRSRLKASIPFAYDDPSNTTTQFKQIIIEAFGGAGVEHAREKLKARCVPLITANEFVVNKLAADEPRCANYRTIYVIISFMQIHKPVSIDTMCRRSTRGEIGCSWECGTKCCIFIASSFMNWQKSSE